MFLTSACHLIRLGVRLGSSSHVQVRRFVRRYERGPLPGTLVLLGHLDKTLVVLVRMPGIGVLAE